MMPRRAITVAATALLLADWTSSPREARAQTEQQRLIDRARLTVDGFASADQMVPMRYLLARARAVVVIPQLVKVSYVVGGAGGSGLLLARDPATHRWSAPAFYTIASGSIGFQIGASASEIVLLIMSEDGLQALLKDKLKLGVDASAAAGPLGVSSHAATTTTLDVDVLSYARSKGLFAGVSFEGAVLQPNRKWNQRCYGRPVTPIEIVERNAVDRSGAAPLIEALERAELHDK